MITIIAIMVTLFVVTVLHEQARSKGIATTAATMGLHHRAGDDGQQALRCQPFEIFNRGHARKIRHVIEAEVDGLRITLIDYQFVTGSGKQRRTHNNAVALIESPRLSVPNFHAFPERFWHRFGELLGMQDIDLDEDPAFSRAFVLRGSERRIRDFFGAELREFLIGHPNTETQTANNLVMFSHPKALQGKTIRQYIESAFTLHRVLAENEPASVLAGNDSQEREPVGS